MQVLTQCVEQRHAWIKRKRNIRPVDAALAGGATLDVDGALALAATLTHR